MMNVFGMASSITSIVNARINANLKQSNGYIIDPTTKRQIPQYLNSPGFIELQALDGSDLKQLDNIAQQGTMQAAYLYGTIAGIVRPDSKGGDVLEFNGESWLVTKVIESWDRGGNGAWTKVAITYQGKL